MADIQAISKQFTDYYYGTFDSSRAGLAPLYRDNSMLTFEGVHTLGAQAIVDKLISLPFQSVVHKVSTHDSQPSDNNSIVISVTGQLLIDNEQNPQFFTQTFYLKHDGSNFYVANDIFRLVYA
ncbi:nuclear transport factor 2 [Lobosporangium transversale]|uniref:Nuclear transport factor 2 n=1 Tax=Lobosporangium transversale TaxID=64571 RepID=A0A1Y2GUL3_9FUNG|nr:nuclear transport factor 2 [Lobosporangium transversale]ORZ22725.1 nuclear transport factor 2 [Lobosporangium transversale]|eukprot:XP_021883279.1 nuclear transport factor 2 [Lobosporangium transversale]